MKKGGRYWHIAKWTGKDKVHEAKWDGGIVDKQRQGSKNVFVTKAAAKIKLRVKNKES